MTRRNDMRPPTAARRTGGALVADLEAAAPPRWWRKRRKFSSRLPLLALAAVGSAGALLYASPLSRPAAAAQRRNSGGGVAQHSTSARIARGVPVRTTLERSAVATSCAHVAVGADTAVDEWGFVCAREQLSADTGCCAESALPRFTCDGCEAAPDGVCCVTFETCISCCLGGAAHAISSAAAALDACEDGCRTSSKSLNGSVWNRYRSEAKYCNHSGAKPAVEPPEAGAVAAAAAAAAASAGRCTGGRLACLLRSWRVRE